MSERFAPGASKALNHSVTLPATNGEPIVVTRYQFVEEPRGAVIIAPAMATPSRFYVDFAQWLARTGFVTYLFDYQGYGESAVTPLTEVEADLLNWADDAHTVLAWVASDAGDLPLTWIGHSLGGQLLAFTDSDVLDRAIIVASGTGYWGHSEGIYRVLAPALWYAIGPTLTKLYGYFPGRKFKILGDLPAPVMRQWTTWCRHPDYLLGHYPEHREKFAHFSVPLTSISFSDDETMSAGATEHLLSFYAGTEVDNVRLTPQEVGHTQIGHMNFFREGYENVWHSTLVPLISSRG